MHITSYFLGFIKDDSALNELIGFLKCLNVSLITFMCLNMFLCSLSFDM